MDPPQQEITNHTSSMATGSITVGNNDLDTSRISDAESSSVIDPTCKLCPWVSTQQCKLSNNKLQSVNSRLKHKKRTRLHLPNSSKLRLTIALPQLQITLLPMKLLADSLLLLLARRTTLLGRVKSVTPLGPHLFLIQETRGGRDISSLSSWGQTSSLLG